MCSSTSLAFAGTKCTCITAAFPARDSNDVNVLRSDGSVWYDAGYSSMPTLVANASLQPVTAYYPAQVMQLSNQASEVGAGSSYTCACPRNVEFRLV